MQIPNLSVDMSGPYPLTVSGNKYIVALILWTGTVVVPGLAFINQEVILPQHDRHIYLPPPGLELTIPRLGVGRSNH